METQITGRLIDVYTDKFTDNAGIEREFCQISFLVKGRPVTLGFDITLGKKLEAEKEKWIAKEVMVLGTLNQFAGNLKFKGTEIQAI